MIYVVGSGPAGVACASAFVSRGARVTMLDAGIGMEPDLQRVLATLREQLPAAWNPADVERITRTTEASDRAIPLKAAYGSLFPYRPASAQVSFESHGVDALPSYARGGFSNVWGGTVLPYHARDIAEWPITVEDLAPHYTAVARMMHLSERKDRLAADFRLFTDGSRFLRSSRQADALMRDLEASVDALEGDGWRFGYSRLAVVAGDGNTPAGCVYCGLCLYGCPYGHIYNSNATLDALRARDTFSYRPDVVVTRVAESADGVRIHGASRATGDPVAFDGERVCLAAGTFGTTAILLASLEAYDATIPMLDSQLFLLPTLRYRGAADVADERLYSLSQIFVELVKPEISSHTVHVQVYTYNDWYVEAMKRRLGLLYPLVRPWLTTLISRLIVFQGYLPSDLSPRINATLRRAGGGHTLVVEAGENASSRSAIAQIVDTIGRHRRHVRAMALTPLLEIGAPGRGYHTGGSFPMQSAPSGTFATDRLGRPNGLERVHAVDATVFPSIPAGPITFSVMANAHRIASECVC